MLSTRHNSCKLFFFSVLLAGLQVVTVDARAQTDSLAFGDKKWIEAGLKGDIYLLPAGTLVLPRFDTMKAAGTVYTSKIDIPSRSWVTGFPGVAKSEYFAVVYTGSFSVKKAGHYTFRLLSDDGAKLFIDKKVVIDNDGLHVAASRLGDVKLSGSKHSFRLEYFQGSQPAIALQLFATLDKENEQVFSADNFILITPKVKQAWRSWLIYIGVGLIIILALRIWLRSRRRIPTD